ncbi:MAG: hypothetical protein EOP70_19260, partial [Variovorax sp.]
MGQRAALLGGLTALCAAGAPALAAAYELQAGVEASFDVRLPAADPSRARVVGAPWIDVGIADVRGLAGTPKLQVARQAVPILQGQRGGSGAGVHAVLPASAINGERIAFPLRLDFALRGTEGLALVPLADGNRIVL